MLRRLFPRLYVWEAHYKPSPALFAPAMPYKSLLSWMHLMT
ncbi:hypothetical protein A2U01_0099194, partial [Trifolium medium]|nr:hypothetical protein [Trifolium medium]